MLIKKIYLIIVIVFSCFANCYSQFNFQRNWGTYFGDERFVVNDSAIDRDGNLYIVGGIAGIDSSNLFSFTTSTSYQQNYGGGEADGFIIKMNSQGAIIWGTFFGGSDFDNILKIDIDKLDNIYLLGCTKSATNISTIGSYQENLNGEGDYFISKFNSDGAIIWSTYYGDNYNDGLYTLGGIDGRPIDICFDGDAHIVTNITSMGSTLGTPNVFQQAMQSSLNLISRWDINGNLNWATYYGYNTFVVSIAVNSSGIYVSGKARDCPPYFSYNTYYGTSNGFSPLPHSCADLYLSKLTNDGQREWSTYFGNGSTQNGINSSSLTLDNSYLYLTGSANFTDDYIADSTSFQSYSGSSVPFIKKFTLTGFPLTGTYNGLTVNNQQIGFVSNCLKLGSNSSVFQYGSTIYDSNIATSDGYKTIKGNYYKDAYVCTFNDFTSKSWGTYYGGELEESDVQFHPYNNNNNFYIVGKTQSLNEIASSNGLQTNKQVFDLINNTQQSAYNIFIAHFDPMPLSNSTFNENSFTIYPNPNNGNFTISLKENATQEVNMILYDVLGKELQQQKLNNSETVIKTNSLSKGIYFAKIVSEKESFTKKIIVE